MKIWSPTKLYVFRKTSLVTKDIFLFNVGKAKTEADVNYDGDTLAVVWMEEMAPPCSLDPPME